MFKNYFCEKCDKVLKLRSNETDLQCKNCSGQLVRIYHSNILTKDISFIQTQKDLIHDMKADLENNKENFKTQFEDL